MQTWTSTLELAGKVLVLIVVLGLTVWGMIRVLQRSEDPARLLFKWALTVIIAIVIHWKIVPLALGSPFVGIPVAALFGLGLAAIWRHTITEFCAKPFSSLYDGGSAQIAPQPYYSIAEARRKQGKYNEAVAEIRKQLEKFPTDFQGQMMLAEIHAENLNDLPGAEVTIHRLCAQQGHAPINIAYALNTLADWHLKYALDREAVRNDLQRIGELLPDSDHAIVAAQRLAHLASTQQLVAAHDRYQPILRAGIQNIGLLKSADSPKPEESNSDGMAAEYVKQLEEHPLDFEVREKLALIYADHYQRLDLAADQLQQLIEMPGQTAKRATHWLNLLADLQVRHGADYATVADTLQQIIERYPHTPGAEIARTRLSHLKLEFRVRETTTTVKMGNYEQNLGLKRPG